MKKSEIGSPAHLGTAAATSRRTRGSSCPCSRGRRPCRARRSCSTSCCSFHTLSLVSRTGRSRARGPSSTCCSLHAVESAQEECQEMACCSNLLPHLVHRRQLGRSPGDDATACREQLCALIRSAIKRCHMRRAAAGTAAASVRSAGEHSSKLLHKPHDTSKAQWVKVLKKKIQNHAQQSAEQSSTPSQVGLHPQPHVVLLLGLRTTNKTPNQPHSAQRSQNVTQGALKQRTRSRTQARPLHIVQDIKKHKTQIQSQERVQK